jgi:hypothetical protein
VKALRRARRLRGADGDGVWGHDTGVLSGNHIRRQIKRKADLSPFQRATYRLHVKACYTDTQRGPACYLETIYTLLSRRLQ